MSALPPFQRFLDAEREVVWRYVVSVVGRGEADDVFQETFMAALRAYPTLQKQRDHNLRGWVLTIAHRKALDHFSATRRRATPTDALPDVPTYDTELPDHELWQRVHDLPAKMRTAVTLRYAGDLTHAEIAQAMGTSEDAARRNTFEGLKRLREVVAR